MERKARVLIIDDEEDICVYTVSMLQRTGRFEAHAVTSARKGIELAKKVLPDLILLDVNMPEMDGGDVARALEECESTRKIPILFVTALLRKNEEAPAVTGKHHYLAKPVQPAELIARIEALLKPRD